MSSLWIAGALVLALIVPCAVRAQDGDAEYRAAIDEAIAEFDAERFPEARALFVRAHRLVPSARTLRGIGMASFEMRDYLEAHRSLRAALADTNRPLTEEQRAEVSTLIDRTRRFLGIYRVTLPEGGAALTVDDRPVELEPDGTLVLPLGAHEIVARPAAGEIRRSVRVDGGEDAELSLVSEPEPEPEPGQPEPEPEAEPIARPEPIRPDLTLPILLLAGGGGLAVGAIVTGLAWWLVQGEEVARCDDAGRLCTNAQAVDGSFGGAIGTTLGLGVLGAGVLIAGIVLLADVAGAPAHAWSCDPIGGQLACGVSF